MQIKTTLSLSLSTFSSIEKRHHQTQALHEGRHLMRDWWDISLLLTDPS
jgi:hypothetical protein